MHEPFLLTRILMRFDTPDEDVHGELSAVAVTPDGSLWVGSDELQTVERLSPLEPYIYGAHRSFHLNDFAELIADEGEVDIEGMDYNEGYLWVTGSHSVKRKKTKGKKVAKDIERLAAIKPELNRCTLVRIPIVDGEPRAEYTPPDQPDHTRPLRAGTLLHRAGENVLIDALRTDDHLAPFLSIPNKENGLDVEGLAVRGDRVFLGLRGPVLRGWAIMIEFEVEEQLPGVLTLKQRDGQSYRKHFVALNGMGIRDMCFLGDDLLLLAGPTMDLEGAMEIFRLRDPLDLEADSITEQDDKRLEGRFYLPFTIGSDHAEGLALLPCLGQDGLLVVYDTPDPARQLSSHALCADVFLL